MTRNRGLIHIIGLWMLCSSGWGGQTVAGKEKQLGQLHSQIKKADIDLKKLQQEKQYSLDQLKALEIQYGRVVSGVNSLQAEIRRQREVLQEIGRKMVDNRKAIQKRKKELEGVVRSAYAMGGKERLKVIFNQQDPVLSSRMLVYFDYLNQARLRKLQRVRDRLAELTQLEQEERQETEALGAALEKQRHEQNELQKVRRAREQLVAQLQRQYSDKKTQLEQLKTNEKKLQQLIASLRRANDDTEWSDEPLNAFTQSKPFALLKGQLPWPLRGRLLQKFGSPRSESRWDGVLINAKEGVAIHAVARGHIVYADWLRGYGLLIIIDHGKGFMTLYAFNQSLYKAVGDRVDAGDVIASVGSSGGRSQAALYFGIRKKGKPVDPVRWCRKIRNNRVG